MSTFKNVCDGIAELLVEKNEAYGDSFAQAGKFLKLLYPEGIKPEQYGDMLTLVRIFDKLKRVATDKDALGENPYQDIAGYAVLAIVQRSRREQADEQADRDFDYMMSGAAPRNPAEPSEPHVRYVIEKKQDDGTCTYLQHPGKMQWTTNFPDAHRFPSHRSAELFLADAPQVKDAEIVAVTNTKACG